LDTSSQIKAAAGGATTIASAGVGFMQGLDPWLSFGAKVMAVAVGLATFTYYVLSIMEKIKNLRKK
jgi:hypothetical protein